MKVLLTVMIWLAAVCGGQVLFGQELWLNKPADWSSTTNQVQVDLIGKLKQPIKEFTATVTLQLIGDGTLDKLLTFRFPDASNFEKNDQHKWSFVNPIAVSGTQQSYAIKSRADDLDNPERFFAVGERVLWENFIIFKIFPTKGKLTITFSDIKGIGADNKTLSFPDISLEIVWADGLDGAQFRADSRVDWPNQSLIVDWYYRSTSAINSINLKLNSPTAVGNPVVSQLGNQRKATLNDGNLQIDASANPYPKTESWLLLGKLTFKIIGTQTGDIELTNIKLTGSDGPINIDPVFKIPIDWYSVGTVQVKLDTADSWWVNGRAEVRLNFRGPFVRHLRATVSLPSGAVVESGLPLQFLNSSGGFDRYILELWDLAGKDDWTALGNIVFRPNVTRPFDTLEIGDIIAKDFQGNNLPVAGGHRLILRYKATSIDEPPEDISLQPFISAGYLKIPDVNCQWQVFNYLGSLIAQGQGGGVYLPPGAYFISLGSTIYKVFVE